MIKIIASKIVKKSQGSFYDDMRDVDWGDEPAPDIGSIGEDNYENYLVDDIEQDTIQQATPQPDWMGEIPTGNELLGIPEGTREIPYDNPFDLIAESLGRETISFEYTNRHGDYVGRRTVEPHDWFVAPTTGNNIVVTWDLDVQDIRAFIIGNIHPGGVRYEGVGVPDRSLRDI